MRYQGSKILIGHKMHPHIIPAEDYYEPFLGGGNFAYHLPAGKYKRIYLSDANRYAIAFFQALRDGWEPPVVCAEEEYLAVKLDYKSDAGAYGDALKFWVGHEFSYMGKFFNKYINSCYGEPEHKLWQYRRSRIAKARRVALMATHLVCQSYADVHPCPGAVVYCDPPYKSTSCLYNKGFSHDDFYDWCREHSRQAMVYVSEYNMPEDFVEIWEKQKTHWGNMPGAEIYTRLERLYVHECNFRKIKKQLSLF